MKHLFLSTNLKYICLLESGWFDHLEVFKDYIIVDEIL
jgi:hypothetical protein